MNDMIKFDLPKNESSIIKVMGVGGGGNNAVTHMFNQGIKGVDFILCNTDAQALEASPVPTKIQLGNKGLGAGSIPSVGRESANEKREEIMELLEKNTQMLFLTAGMGGGTGTGATPIIASIARELGILTVGIVTMPFSFEGRKRKLQAEEGIKELKEHVDTLLIIINDKLRLLHGDLKLSDAFHRADDVLTTAARGIAEIVTVTGYMNVDLEDIRTVMKESGRAIMGSATAEGENRAAECVESAINSPLLNDNDIFGASNILLYITSGEEEVSMDEVSDITDFIQEKAGSNAEIIWGNGFDESLGNKISITLVATGFSSDSKSERDKNKTIYHLSENLKNKKTKPDDGENNKTEEIELIRKKEETEKKKIKEEDKEKVNQEEKTKESEHQNKNTTTGKSENKQTVVFDLTSGEKKYRDNMTPEVSEQPVKNKQQDSDNNTYIEHDKKENVEREDSNELEKKAQERINRLKDLSIKLRSPGGLAELENEPAYIRKKVKLENTPSSSDSQVSKYSLSEDKDKKTKIKSNNSYIHDKPD